MRKILILGVLAILTTMALANVVSANDKEIDTDEFTVGDETSYINITTPTVTIGDDLYNNDAKLMIINNATYSAISFDVSAGPDGGGNYPSEVTIDLGENGRAEYKFGGFGAGDWGNQNLFLSEDKESAYYGGSSYPSQTGDIFYIKLPSEAVVKSASVNLTHPSGSVSKTVSIPSDNNWGRGYMYYYNSNPYGYSYYYPSANAGSYVGYMYYPAATDSSSGSGYPLSNGYLSWDLNNEDFSVPYGANIKSYKLLYPINNYRYSGSWPGESGSYHHGEMTYKIYPVTSAWGSSYTSTNTVYYDTDAMISDFKKINPSWDDTPVAEYTVPAYHGTSSSYYYNMGVEYDLSSLMEAWNDDTLDNYGVMIAMAETPYCDDLLQWSGYSYYSGTANYRYYYYRGYMWSPGSSSSYNSYKPRLLIEYNLDSIDPWLDIGDDKTNDWSISGKFDGYQVFNGWQGSINQYLRNHFPDEIDNFGKGWTYVPIRMGADAAGQITFTDLKVEYDYTAKVTYNPTSGDLLSELESQVPVTEEGWSLLPIMVRSNTKGEVTFDHLELIGEKPNYRPMVNEIPDIDVDEGTVSENILVVSDQFFDLDQDARTLQYIIQKNDQEEHVDLFLSMDEGGNTLLGIDTSKDENWYGDVRVRISGTDDGGKDIWTNMFMLHVLPVNDHPVLDRSIPPIAAKEGIDPLLIEYTAPSGRNVAMGKETMVFDGRGELYFSDIEEDRIYLDFELLDPDMEPVNIAWENEDRHKIYRGPDNEVYLTILPPEYTDDPDNYLLVFGSDPDFTTMEGDYYLKVYASDDPEDLHGQTALVVPITVSAVNDPPSIALIPDIVMNEDESYVSPMNFIEEYVSDIDNEMDELEVTLVSPFEELHPMINGDGKLEVHLDMDFNGVIPVTLEVSDGENIAKGQFNVRIRSINDPPVLIVDNLFEGQTIDELYRIRGTADDIEKSLKYVQIAVTEQGGTLYIDDWVQAEGAYVWQSLLDIRGLEEGFYTIYIRAFDGRDFSPVKEFNIRVISPIETDLSKPPEITIETGLSGDLSGNVDVRGTVTDDTGFVSFVEYRIDGEIWRKAVLESGTEWRVVMDTNTLTNEEHNLSLRAYDGKLYSDIAFKRFIVFNEDSDGDGISNEIEVALLMDPFNKIDGAMDFDSDGFSNAQELRENTDPFDGESHPTRPEDEEALFDTWALIFMAASIISAIIIIGLFVLNIRLERNMHQWREDLNRKRVERKPKTLLQKIVEIAPTFIGAPVAPEGPALPGGQPAEKREALPPVEEPPKQPSM